MQPKPPLECRALSPRSCGNLEAQQAQDPCEKGTDWQALSRTTGETISFPTTGSSSPEFQTRGQCSRKVQSKPWTTKTSHCSRSSSSSSSTPLQRSGCSTDSEVPGREFANLAQMAINDDDGVLHGQLHKSCEGILQEILTTTRAREF